MIKMRHMALAATLMLTLTACGKTEDATPTAATSAPGGNHLFAYVPADSPYLVGNLEPISDEVIDTFLTRAEPALLAVQDEISLGLAPAVIRDIYIALQDIRREGASVIIVEQNISQALAEADRVYCLLEGRVTLTGRPSELTRDQISAAYFGGPA